MASPSPRRLPRAFATATRLPRVRPAHINRLLGALAVRGDNSNASTVVVASPASSVTSRTTRYESTRSSCRGKPTPLLPLPLTDREKYDVTDERECQEHARGVRARRLHFVFTPTRRRTTRHSPSRSRSFPVRGRHLLVHTCSFEKFGEFLLQNFLVIIISFIK